MKGKKDIEEHHTRVKEHLEKVIDDKDKQIKSLKSELGEPQLEVNLELVDTDTNCFFRYINSLKLFQYAPPVSPEAANNKIEKFKSDQETEYRLREKLRKIAHMSVERLEELEGVKSRASKPVDLEAKRQKTKPPEPVSRPESESKSK